MSITVIGLEEVVTDFKTAPQTIRRESKHLLDGLGVWTSGRAKAYTMDAGAVDLGELVQGIHHDTKKTSGGFKTAIKPSEQADKYAIYVEEGTRPHTPPVSALQGWADRHGIPVWAVVRKIQREGTAPRYMFRDTFDDLKGHVDKELPKFAIILVNKL